MEWISVKKELPIEVNCNYIVHVYPTDHSYPPFVTWSFFMKESGDKFPWFYDKPCCEVNDKFNNVTHWMKFPEGPNIIECPRTPEEFECRYNDKCKKHMQYPKCQLHRHIEHDYGVDNGMD